MSSQCKGLCVSYVVKILFNEKYYDNNRVFCRQCERFMKIPTVRCPCCKSSVRYRPRSKRVYRQRVKRQSPLSVTKIPVWLKSVQRMTCCNFIKYWFSSVLRMTQKGVSNHFNVKYLSGYGFSIKVKDSMIYCICRCLSKMNSSVMILTCFQWGIYLHRLLPCNHNLQQLLLDDIYDHVHLLQQKLRVC